MVVVVADVAVEVMEEGAEVMEEVVEVTEVGVEGTVAATEVIAVETVGTEGVAGDTVVEVRLLLVCFSVEDSLSMVRPVSVLSECLLNAFSRLRRRPWRWRLRRWKGWRRRLRRGWILRWWRDLCM